MATVKQLQEERAPIGEEIRRMADTLKGERTDFTPEEREKWERLNRDFDSFTTRIEASRRAERVSEVFDERSDPRSTPGLEDTSPRRRRSSGEVTHAVEEARALAFQGWARRQNGLELTDDHRRACKLVGVNPNKRSLMIGLPRRPSIGSEKRSLSAVTGNAGAYTIPQGFVNNLEKALKDYNGCRQVADVLRTDSGNSLPWPNTNDTGNLGERIGENTGVALQDVAFGQIVFGAYKYSSKMVLVPSELLEDSAFMLGDELFPMLGERIGRKQEVDFTTGTGSSQPQGVVTGAALGVTAASSSTITGDEIISLIHSVDPAYRRDPSFRLMFHDSILAIIRKLKDGIGRYLFEEGQNGAPDKIKGVEYVINQNMDSGIVTGAKPMLAGPFRKFKIRDVNKIRLVRLEERYAEADQVGFIAYMRSDSHLLDAGTHPIKHLLIP
jgi:HK97 family phage major capsid protein